MENFEDLESILLQQPWTSVSFAESTTLMVKAWFGDAGYALLLSDLSNMWYETADTEAIQHRSKELNKRLTAHVSSFLNHLKSLIYPLLEGEKNSSTCFSCQLNSSMLTLHVKSELSGLPFYWDFHCSTVPVEMMSCHFVRPLMAMSLVLQCQVRELASLLYQKDAEIEDYRESGAVLSRERLKTEPFKEESFLQTFQNQEYLGPPAQFCGRCMADVDPRVALEDLEIPREVFTQILPQACQLGDGQLFTSNLKELYMAVTQEQTRATYKRHREASGDSETVEHSRSQDLAQKVVDLPAEEEKTGSQPVPAQSVQDTVAPSSQTQKAQLPIVKAKKKKAKGLFG